METAVLVSGGVDSSVALAEAVATGGRVTAFYLKIWLEDDLRGLGSCPWQEDLDVVRAVCADLEVPLEVLSFQEIYHDRVVAYVVRELEAGRTPSPDLLCNREIKLGAFLDGPGAGFDRVVTGHYARVQAGPPVELRRGHDPVKDQTYFLAYTPPERLARCWFPVGRHRKATVRSRARELGLPNANRKDSQGICFLGKIPYRSFVRHYLGTASGQIRELESGRNLGRHDGVWFYTIGQRQGLGLSGGPWYVVAKDPADRTLWVSHVPQDYACGAFTIAAVNTIAPIVDGRAFVRIRHGAALLGCTILQHQDRIEVTLDRPDPGIADGQFAVLYDGDRCLGCGVIASPGARDAVVHLQSA